VSECEGGGVVWAKRNGRRRGVLALYAQAAHGELGQRGGREVGVRPRHWLGMAVWTSQALWMVALEASGCRLVLASLQHNGALQVFDQRMAGQGGIASRSEGERESEHAPEESGLPPLSTRMS
jgi:hypothetical protein